MTKVVFLKENVAMIWSFPNVVFIWEYLLYLEETAGHGKDPPEHLDDLTQVRQERQPAEGKSH